MTLGKYDCTARSVIIVHIANLGKYVCTASIFPIFRITQVGELLIGIVRFAHDAN